MTTASTSSTFTTTSTYTRRSSVTSSRTPLSTGTSTSTSTGSTTSSTSSMSFVAPEGSQDKAYASGSLKVTAACTPAEMRLGCRLGVADSMQVDESQVGCLILSLQIADTLPTRRLSVNTFDWDLLFMVEVPTNDTAIIEEWILNLSNHSDELATALNRSLLEVVNDTAALSQSFRLRELGEVSVPSLSDGSAPELEVLMWVSFLLGKVRCSETAQVRAVRAIGHATATCFGREENEVADGVARRVRTEGAYSVTVPSTIFEEIHIDDFVLVVIGLNAAAAPSLEDGERLAVGAVVSVVLGAEQGFIYPVSDLQSPINVTFEGLPRERWECAAWEKEQGWLWTDSGDDNLEASTLACAA
eukprot:126739-Amphidinium_carterae.1